MNHALLSRELVRRLHRLRTRRPGRDPIVVAEALALAVVIDAVGAALDLAEPDLDLLATEGARALAKWSRGDDALIAGRIARAGLEVVAAEREGKRRPGPRGAPAAHAGAVAIARMLRAEPDPLSAALVALHVRRCERCTADVVTARDTGSSAAPAFERAGERMLAAAAEPAAMQAPSDGRVIARLSEPAVEAILFESRGVRRLAIYGDRRVPIRLVAAGVATEDATGGYWIGRVEPGVTVLEATLHVGDAVLDWRILLGPPAA